MIARKDTDTEQLSQRLEKMSLDAYDTYMSEGDLLPAHTVETYFKEFMKREGLSKTNLVRGSGLDRTYGYQILNGLRHPSKDKLLALCIAGKMPLKEIQRVLKIGQTGVLYPKDPRDAVIILCINNKLYSITEINNILEQKGFEIIR